MDRKQAVTILKRKTTIPGDGYTWEQINEAIDMAISALSRPNEPLTIEQLREMGGQPYWHVGLRKESTPPHWNILYPFYAKHIEDYRYGENWLAYRRPLEGEEDT